MNLFKKLITSTFVLITSCALSCPANAAELSQCYHKEPEVTIIGDSGTGKTSLAAQICILDEFTENYKKFDPEEHTKESKTHHIKLKNVPFYLCDTSVNTDYDRVLSRIESGDVLIAVFDVTIEPSTFISNFEQQKSMFYSTYGKCIIVANKIDVKEEYLEDNIPNNKAFLEKECESLQNDGCDVDYYETSALTGEGVDILINDLITYFNPSSALSTENDELFEEDDYKGSTLCKLCYVL